MNTKAYAVVIERGPTSVGAYVPDLPGCVAVARTVPQVEKLIATAIEMHVAGLREDGLPVPNRAPKSAWSRWAGRGRATTSKPKVL